MALYPSNMAPIGVKLWENAFQTIPDISFFDVQKHVRRFFFQNIFGLIFCFKKVAFRRSYGFLDVMGRCASTNDPRSFDYQLYTTFRRGVKVVHTVFEVVFGPKRTSTIWCYDVMII